jgi:hypothetical protein
MQNLWLVFIRPAALNPAAKPMALPAFEQQCRSFQDFL